MHTLARFFAAAFLISLGANAQSVPTVAPPIPEHGVIIRVVKDNPDRYLVEWLAENAEPTKLAPEGYPTLPQMTGNEVAKILCGQSVPEYWKVFSRKNNLAAGASFDPTARLDAKAYDYSWPACFYYEQGDFRHTIVEGDTASAVFQKETGSVGTAEQRKLFFRKSRIPNLAKLVPGQVLRYQYRTRPITVKAIGGQARFIELFNKTARTLSPRSEPADLISDGGIITADFSGSGDVEIISGPKECGSNAVAPFDVARLEQAYINGVRTHRSVVRIVVADNGFFGGKRSETEPGKIEMRSLFDRRFFDITPDQTRGTEAIGPQLSLSSGESVKPLNFENGFPPDTVPTAISGHGTHVVGLALGGPARSSEKIFAGEQPYWLDAVIVAFSPGDLVIDETPASQFDAALQQTFLSKYPPDIVNMSLKFGPSAENSFRTLFQKNREILFVVAAGNQGVDFDSSQVKLYPAVLGTESNVMTVAAVDSVGSLAKYSNRSAHYVDIAAPGCNIESTLDGLTLKPLSGTSQAAPIVTFAAALLMRQNIVTPAELKHRLVLSGDIITGMNAEERDDGTVRVEMAGRDTDLPVRSRSRLNIVKALYKDYDYMRYYDETGQVREVLGRLGERSGPACGRPRRDFRKVFAFKRSTPHGQAWCFWNGELEPKPVDSAGDHIVEHFQVNKVIAPDGIIQSHVYDIYDTRLNDIDEFILSEENIR